MNSLLSFELTKSTPFFAAPGKRSHRLLMDGFKNTTALTEDDKKEDETKIEEGDRDIPGEKPEATVKP